MVSKIYRYLRAIDSEDVVADGIQVLGERCFTGFLSESLWVARWFGRVKLAAVGCTDQLLDFQCAVGTCNERALGINSTEPDAAALLIYPQGI